MKNFLETCERAARAGGRVLIEWQGRIRATEKGPKDLVTEADVASQDAIRDVVLGEFPEHLFLGEESPDAAALAAASADARGRFRWIVDPLDGTANYVHGLPNFAVSIALEQDGRLLAGVVFDPILNECFSAAAGEGAWLNGQPIRCSGCRQIGQSMLAASFSANVPRGSPEIASFVEALHVSRAIRRLGSAALNLSYVACGRLDGYWATSVKAWDVAAGALLVVEAGGVLTDIDGRPFNLADPRLLTAATPELHGQLRQAISTSSRA